MANNGLICLVCGKYMYPQALLDARRQLGSGGISHLQYRQVVRKCLTALVEKQRNVGLSSISDGCIDREFWDLDVYFGLNGVERRQTKSGHVYDDCNDGPTPVVTSRINYNENHTLFEQHRQLQGMLNSEEHVVMLLPAPAYFLLQLLIHDTTWLSVYADIQTLADDIVTTYNATIARLYRDGCRTLILEDRSWQSLCSRDGIKRILQSGHDPYSLATLLRDVNDLAMANMPFDFDLMLYLRRLDGAISTWFMSGHCLKITDCAFSHHNIGTYVLDMPDSSEDEVAALLKRLPSDKSIILGIVDGRHPQLEQEDALRGKIMVARGLIGSRLRGVTPIGGFKRENTPISCNAFTEEDQWRKIRLLQQVVATL